MGFTVVSSVNGGDNEMNAVWRDVNPEDRSLFT
jgi:hypothetical protein